MVQTNNGGTAVLGQDWWYQTNYASTMTSVYGSDATSIASRAFVWASEIDIKMVAPAANIVGTYYEGVINNGQLAAGNLTVNQLIAISNRIEGGKNGYKLKGSIVNHQLAFWQQQYAVGDADNDLESIHYVILQTPVMSITTGTTTPFSIIANVASNYLLWPRANDTFANSIGNSMVHSGVSTGKNGKGDSIHRVDPMADEKPGFKNWLSSVFSMDTLKSVASSVLPYAISAISGNPMPAIASMASTSLGKSVASGVGSLFTSMLQPQSKSQSQYSSSFNNVGPLASNPYSIQVDPGQAAREAQVDKDIRSQDFDFFIRELTNLQQQPARPMASKSAVMGQLRTLEAKNSVYWLNGVDIRYEIDKCLNGWGTWSGIAAHEQIWNNIKQQLDQLKSFYENVDRIEYDFLPLEKREGYRGPSSASVERRNPTLSQAQVQVLDDSDLDFQATRRPR